MPITTWKIMLRRAGQAGYHYVSTHQRGWAPSVGEQVEFIVEGKTVKMTIAETFKDRSTKEGIDVFTVRVDETKAVFE
jgi:ABC-type polar amino acid transport system ATPase subunit